MAQRIKAPFWRRQPPKRRHDITLLRPSSLPKRKRFESMADAKAESARSETLLRTVAGGEVYADFLSECRAGYYRCNKPFCPICARKFRRWFIGELLRLTEQNKSMQIFTVLLQAAPPDKIEELDPERHRAGLRKRLQRNGLDDAVVIGGFEIVYKASLSAWVLHANLLVIGGSKSAWRKFADSFFGKAPKRPVVKSPLLDRPKQLSYLLKFTTYHRPYTQSGASRSQAVPLNRANHVALVRWMDARDFQDFAFLFNARRRAIKIYM